MSESKHRITSCSNEVSANPHYKDVRENLERLLKTILSKTSGANTIFNKIMAEGYNESAKPTKIDKLSVDQDKKDKGCSRITVRIQLAGYIEIWLVRIYFNKSVQKNIVGFIREMKNASKVVCAEENARYSPDTKKDVPSQPDNEAGTAKPTGEPPVPPKPGRKRRVMTNSIITDAVKLDILEAWMKLTVGLTKIDQREFWKILTGLNIIINKQLVLNLLVKNGLLKVSTPIPRYPIVEITESGLSWLDERKHQSKIAEMEAAKAKQLQKILDFQKEALPQFQNFQKLLSASVELEKIARNRVEIPQQITELQEKLAGLDQEEKSCVEKIKRLSSLIDRDKITDLIEIANQSKKS